MMIFPFYSNNLTDSAAINMLKREREREEINKTMSSKKIKGISYLPGEFAFILDTKDS